MYYAAFASIDRHNHSHQDALQLEQKIRTLNFDMQVKSTILGMMIVDTWLVFSKTTGATVMESRCSAINTGRFFLRIVRVTCPRLRMKAGRLDTCSEVFNF
jgi:hypothetical protein